MKQTTDLLKGIAVILLASLSMLSQALESLDDHQLSGFSAQAGIVIEMDTDLSIQELALYDDESSLVLEGIRVGQPTDGVNIEQPEGAARSYVVMDVDGEDGLIIDSTLEPRRIYIENAGFKGSDTNGIAKSFGSFVLDYEGESTSIITGRGRFGDSGISIESSFSILNGAIGYRDGFSIIDGELVSNEVWFTGITAAGIGLTQVDIVDQYLALTLGGEYEFIEPIVGTNQEVVDRVYGGRNTRFIESLRVGSQDADPQGGLEILLLVNVEQYNQQQDFNSQINIAAGGAFGQQGATIDGKIRSGLLLEEDADGEYLHTDGKRYQVLGLEETINDGANRIEVGRGTAGFLVDNLDPAKPNLVRGLWTDGIYTEVNFDNYAVDAQGPVFSDSGNQFALASGLYFGSKRDQNGNFIGATWGVRSFNAVLFGERDVDLIGKEYDYVRTNSDDTTLAFYTDNDDANLANLSRFNGIESRFYQTGFTFIRPGGRDGETGVTIDLNRIYLPGDVNDSNKRNEVIIRDSSWTPDAPTPLETRLVDIETYDEDILAYKVVTNSAGVPIDAEGNEIANPLDPGAREQFVYLYEVETDSNGDPILGPNGQPVLRDGVEVPENTHGLRASIAVDVRPTIEVQGQDSPGLGFGVTADLSIKNLYINRVDIGNQTALQGVRVSNLHLQTDLTATPVP